MNIKKRIKSFFFEKDGEKEVLRSKRIKAIFSSILAIVILLQILWPEDKTSYSKSTTQLNSSSTQSQGSKHSTSTKANEVIKSHQQSYNDEKRRRSRRSKQLQMPEDINLNATQVIERQNLKGSRKALPSGSNFIGKLLNGVDTRNQNQVLKVSLPYGAKHRSGGSIPKDSTLLGAVSYSGQGDKIFISFNRIIFPNGDEFQIDAQALSSYDYSPGLVGIHHGNTDLRVAASMGLTIVSAAADVMTTRNTIGTINQAGIQELSPEPTMRNAMLQGASKVTKQEANRQAGQINQKQDYITVEAGSDLIVSLLTPFTGKRF